MKVHFIAIGGSIMHNLAIALHKKGYIVSGSDDEIFEPSRSRLAKYNILPEKTGWNPDNVHPGLDAVILGMHARGDNPELIRAKKLGVKIFSFPEYIYEQSKDKIRVVIGGSHGKTTITSIIMHVLEYNKKDFDYMVGANLEGFETMVKLTKEEPLIILEGDEYLSSPLDRRPKFHLYKPHIALITGIAWDHINVFPTYEGYVKQFEIFIDLIENNGSLIWFNNDNDLEKLVENSPDRIKKTAYSTHEHIVKENKTCLVAGGREVPLGIFGEHNLQNINGARLVCNEIGITDKQFYDAISSFKGASKRLQLLNKNQYTSVYLDFAHAPSKLKATTRAVRKQYPGRELVACMELHTFSSLKEEFLPHYAGSMEAADEANVYFNPDVVKHKKLKEITPEQVIKAFDGDNLTVYTDSGKLVDKLLSTNWKNKNLLLMSSGNFSGIDFRELADQVINI